MDIYGRLVNIAHPRLQFWSPVTGVPPISQIFYSVNTPLQKKCNTWFRGLPNQEIWGQWPHGGRYCKQGQFFLHQPRNFSHGIVVDPISFGGECSFPNQPIHTLDGLSFIGNQTKRLKNGRTSSMLIWYAYSVKDKHLFRQFTPWRVIKQCPWGTILENGAFFYKKGTILVPLGHQNKVVPPDKRAPFFKTVPQGHHNLTSGVIPTPNCISGWETPRSNFKMKSPSSTGVPVLRVYLVQCNVAIDMLYCLDIMLWPLFLNWNMLILGDPNCKYIMLDHIISAENIYNHVILWFHWKVSHASAKYKTLIPLPWQH